MVYLTNLSFLLPCVYVRARVCVCVFEYHKCSPKQYI